MLRPSIHRTLGAVASGSASTSFLDGIGSGPARRKSVGSSIREIFMTEQLRPQRRNPRAHGRVQTARSSRLMVSRFQGRPRIMPQIQPIHVQPAQLPPVRCRFEMRAADAPLSHEFCVFELPGCGECANARHNKREARNPEDPMKSQTWRGWIAHACSPGE